MFAAIAEIALKLWNRGIDIGVGVITSIMVAGIGLLFWKVKLVLDLHADERKQRQQHRIAEEIDLETKRRVTLERHERLRRDVETFAARAETVANAFQLADCWEQYFKWLLENGLDLFPGNLRITTEHSGWGYSLRNSVTHGQHVPPEAKEVAAAIRSTEMPLDQ